MKSGSAFVSVQQTSFLLPPFPLPAFPSLTCTCLRPGPIAHSPRNANVCLCVCEGGAEFAGLLYFDMGIRILDSFVASPVCSSGSGSRRSFICLFFTQTRTPPPPHTLLPRAQGKANPIPKPGSNVKYLYVHYNSSGPGRAGPGMSGSWMRVPLACWPENFSILCAAVNVKAWLRCLLFPTPRSHSPFTIHHLVCPGPMAMKTGSRPGRFKGACMRACDCNSNGIQCAINTHVLQFILQRNKVFENTNKLLQIL